MSGSALERHARQILAEDWHSQPDTRDCQLPLQCKVGDFVLVLVNPQMGRRVWWVGKVDRVDDKGARLNFPCE